MTSTHVTRDPLDLLCEKEILVDTIRFIKSNKDEITDVVNSEYIGGQRGQVDRYVRFMRAHIREGGQS